MARKPKINGEVPKRGPGRPPKIEETTVRCLRHNLWTSRGKVFKGDHIRIPATEAAGLDASDAVKIVE